MHPLTKLKRFDASFGETPYLTINQEYSYPINHKPLDPLFRANQRVTMNLSINFHTLSISFCATF